METYIVQYGWMALADRRDGTLKIRVLKAGAVVTTQPHVSHNVYLPQGAIVHTVKHGEGSPGDWHSAPELDAATKHLSVDEINLLSETTDNLVVK